MRVSAGFFLLLSIVLFLLSINPVVGKKEAPNFTLVDINGNKFSLSSYRGKIVLIDFFRVRPPCQGCIDAIPHIKGVYNKYSQDQLIIMSISVSSSDTNDILRDFVQQYDIPWIMALGTSQIAVEYGVEYIPSLFIIDTNGYIGHGPLLGASESELISKIDSLLSGTENGDSNDNSNGDSNGDSDAGQTGPPYTLIAIIGGAVIVSLVVGIVVAGQLLGWSEPAKKRRSRKRKR